MSDYKENFELAFVDFLEQASVEELEEAQEKIADQINITTVKQKQAVIDEMRALAEKAGLPFDESMFTSKSGIVYAHPDDSSLTWKGVVKGKIPDWVKAFKAEKGIEKLEDVISHLKQVKKTKRTRKTA